MGVKLDLSL